MSIGYWVMSIGNLVFSNVCLIMEKEITSQQLNLPPIQPRIKQSDNKDFIFDSIRKIWVSLTPEEWVRQHLINYLTTEMNYPASLMKVEKGIKQLSGTKRTDIVVFDKKAKPLMIIECKSYNVELTQETINQAANYNVNLNAPYLLISNGLKHITFFLDFQNNKISQLQSIPDYNII